MQSIVFLYHYMYSPLYRVLQQPEIEKEVHYSIYHVYNSETHKVKQVHGIFPLCMYVYVRS